MKYKKWISFEIFQILCTLITWFFLPVDSNFAVLALSGFLLDLQQSSKSRL